MNQYWQSHPTRPFLLLNGSEDAVVHTKERPGYGYLWVVGKECGYEKSLAEAMETVEVMMLLNANPDLKVRYM